LVFLRDEESPLPPPISLEAAVAKPAAAATLQLPEIDSSALAPSAIPDWLAAGELAAARVGSVEEGGALAFGSVPRPAPKPHKTKPFGWDKSHTQRVEAVPGGISVRLGSRCTVVFAPLPVGGCSLGKIPARGDLFEEMPAPAVPGDWRNSAQLRQSQ
jgi:hypothetical protein